MMLREYICTNVSPYYWSIVILLVSDPGNVTGCFLKNNQSCFRDLRTYMLTMDLQTTAALLPLKPVNDLLNM